MHKASPYGLTSTEISDAATPALVRDVAQALAVSGVTTLRQALPRISAELERARRYVRPMSILCAAINTDGPLTDGGRHGGQASGPHGVLMALLAALLRDTVRSADIVTFSPQADSQCVVVMPEVDREGARQAVDRLVAFCAAQQLPLAHVGVSVFPDDAWTLEDLIAHAATHPLTAESSSSPDAQPVQVLPVVAIEGGE